jgi:hypothetical protein
MTDGRPRGGLVLRTSRDRMTAGPTADQVRAEVEYLPRDGWLVLECDGDAFAQVWLRPDGVYQVEHGFGALPEPGGVRHAALRSALTVSRDKVSTALGRWAHADPDWAAVFTWSSVPLPVGG